MTGMMLAGLWAASLSPALPSAVPASGGPVKEAAAVNTVEPVIDRALRRVVKIYGATIAREHGYGSGVVMSPDGHVVTVSSLLLEASNLRVVTPDGHVHAAEVLYRDEYRQLALLKMGRYPMNVDTGATVREQMTPAVHDHFEPSGALVDVEAGDYVFAVGNTFKVADGDEPVSVLRGIVCGLTRLDAERGVQEFPFRGDVILLDAITSSPGMAGGALVDIEGRWVGLIGRPATSRMTNTYVNFAYPMQEVKNFLRDAQSGAAAATRPAAPDRAQGYHGIRLSRVGYRTRLPFVQSVARGSPAEGAGVRADDLIISANGTAVPRARAFTELCDRLYAGDELSLIVKRGEELLTLRMTLTEENE